jgi:predicted PurR-regulated permease PerM
MKTFFAVFVCCFILCCIAAPFMGRLSRLISSGWALIGLSALLLAVPITVFISLITRIEDLEESVRKLSEDKQD